MSIFNALPAETNPVALEGMGLLLRLLSPLAPHITHHLWRELGFGEDILHAPWPQVDDAALVQATLQYVVQINGKLRGHIAVDAEADKASIERAALADANVQKHIEGKQLKKVIVVPGKLVNLVVA